MEDAPMAKEPFLGAWHMRQKAQKEVPLQADSQSRQVHFQALRKSSVEENQGYSFVRDRNLQVGAVRQKARHHLRTRFQRSGIFIFRAKPPFN